MQCIYPEYTSAATASAENADYPVSNLLDDHPKKVWKATSKDATATITVSGAGDAFALFNTNADTVTAEVKTTSLATTIWGPETYDVKGIDSVYELITGDAEYFESLWVDYTHTANAHKVLLNFSAATGTIIEAGIVKAGNVLDIDDPQYGLQESIKDYSIVKELNNGAFYVRKRDLVKTYTGSIYLAKETDYYYFMRNTALWNGPNPLAWKISENLTNNDWIVFARFVTPPNSSHEFYSHSRVNFSLIEVI